MTKKIIFITLACFMFGFGVSASSDVSRQVSFENSVRSKISSFKLSLPEIFKYNGAKIQSSPVFCEPFVYDSEGNQYKTVHIGEQCWMQENLRVGVRIDATTHQSDDSVIQKYCLDDNESNCSLYGGLYQWPQAMLLSYEDCLQGDCSESIREQHQGICPLGWHIPNDQEFAVLEQYTVEKIGSVYPQYECSTIGFAPTWRRCADSVHPNGNPAGNTGGEFGASRSLRKVGQGNGEDLMGFSLIMAGYHNGWYYYPISQTRLWLADQDGTHHALRRLFMFSATTIHSGTDQRHYANSVRCLQDY